ncbi:hypothetical protein [Caldiplasma sukawensis]
MGKITDGAIALFVIIIGFFVLYRLGITLPVVERVIRNFFFPSSGTSTNNTTAFISLPLMTMTNSKLRQRTFKKIEEIKRRLFKKRIKQYEEGYRE